MPHFISHRRVAGLFFSAFVPVAETDLAGIRDLADLNRFEIGREVVVVAVVTSLPTVVPAPIAQIRPL